MDALTTTTTPGPDTQAVWAALAEVYDPEIPVISLVDLGVIHDVRVSGGEAQVTLLPTFLGCPALDQMKLDVLGVLARLGLAGAVHVEAGKPWSSDLITPRGRALLRESGFAPPARSTGAPSLLQLQGPARCPYCESVDTVLENIFGPTPCRSLRYCRACRQPFEQFKTL